MDMIKFPIHIKEKQICSMGECWIAYYIYDADGKFIASNNFIEDEKLIYEFVNKVNSLSIQN